MPVIHESHLWKSSIKVIYEWCPWQSSIKVIHDSHPSKSSMKVIHDSPCQPDHDCKPFSACLVLRSKEDEKGPPKMKETWKVPISLSTLFFLKLPSVHVLIYFSRLVIRSVGRKYRLWWAGQLLGTSQLLSAKIENGRIALYLGKVLNIYLQLCTLGETGTDNLEMFGPYIIFL